MNRQHATKDFWLAALRSDSPALQDAVVQAGPGAEVPSCPDWTGRELVTHLTATLHWVRETVPRGVTTRPTIAPEPHEPADWDEALDGLEGLDRAGQFAPQLVERGVPLGALALAHRRGGRAAGDAARHCLAHPVHQGRDVLDQIGAGPAGAVGHLGGRAGLRHRVLQRGAVGPKGGEPELLGRRAPTTG